MREIRLDKKRLQNACLEHVSAVAAYISKKPDAYQRALYEAVTEVVPYKNSFDACRIKNDWGWLEKFLLADVAQLREWTKNRDLLQFDQFLNLYKNRFAAGELRYVDETSKYNAYQFVENLGVQVCPYCDEEYLDVIRMEDGRRVRTLELDHFFAKSQYPALAMCFFNLVPSGQACNGLKKEYALGMSPHETGIEECTYLYPDIPVGVNMENVPVEACKVLFHPTGGMERNVEALGLEARYEKYKGKAHKYLTIKQQYDEAKVEEMVRMGLFSTKDMAYRILYEESLVDDGVQPLLGKLKHDLTGR